MKGLSKEIVLALSAQKKEPTWMLQLRLEGLKKYQELASPNYGPNLENLDISKIETYVEPAAALVKKWDNVPGYIREVFENLGIPEAEREGLAGVGAQYDSELVYHNIKKQVEKSGVVYLPMEKAVKSTKVVEIGGEKKSITKIVKEYFMKLVPPDDHKFAALHAAVWSGGSFIYVPKNTTVEIPLQSYFRFEAPGAGQFEHTLIILDEGADLHYIEGCSAPRYSVANLHSGCVELYVGKRAKLKYSTVESWSKNMYNLNTKRAIVAESGKIEWVTGSFGSCVSMLYPMSILNGENSTAEHTCISFAGEGQNLDTGIKVVHAAPNTKSFIDAKSLSKSGGICTYRSKVKILPGAKKAKSFADCKSLILDDKSCSNTIPLVDSKNPSADIGHEATVGKIGKSEINYLMSRGFSETEAEAIIVRGFADSVSKELPVEYAIEMNNLIKMEVKGGL